MICTKYSNPSMMAHVEAIFLIRGKHTKYYSQATIGQLFLRMQRMLVVEPDYLPDAEVLAFSRVYTP
jgi:hypothetical protein